MVVNVHVLTEGWDAPPVKCAVLACPTRSLTRYLQMAGRILRPWEGVRPVVLDHAGNAHWFRVPTYDHPIGLDVTPPRRGRGVGAAMVRRAETGDLVERTGDLVEMTWRDTVSPNSSHWSLFRDCWNETFDTHGKAVAFARRKGWL